MKARRLNWMLLAKSAFVLLVAWLFLHASGGSDGGGRQWFSAIMAALLALYLVKPFCGFRRRADKQSTAHTAVEGLHFRSPRADMERRWRRLGSVRGKLLTDVDRQSDLSEALYRLEYRRKSGGDQSWLTPMDQAQAYDLQLPTGIRKRKGKPKRQLYG